MAASISHKKEYMIIFAALAGLTGLELFVPGMEASKVTKGSILGALAVVKAGDGGLVLYAFKSRADLA